MERDEVYAILMDRVADVREVSTKGAVRVDVQSFALKYNPWLFFGLVILRRVESCHEVDGGALRA